MAYNNGFPVNYQQTYYPQHFTGTQYPQPQNSSIIWVQGEAGAKSYLVAPNNTVQLWDSEAQTIYLKSADASGMPSIKVLDYTIRDATPAAAPAVGLSYATKEELEAVKTQIMAEIEKIRETPDE